MISRIKVICRFSGVDFRKDEVKNDILHAALEGTKRCKEYGTYGFDLGTAFPPEGETECLDTFILGGSEPVVHAAISGIIKEFMYSFLAGDLRFELERRS